jgi:acyl-CoA synthetase (AMP-forming)/AMP-acid ligase II
MTTVSPLKATETIPGVLAETVARHGDRVALIDGDTASSYRQLDEQVDQAARALVGSGVTAGDRVAIWAPNIVEWVPTALAIYRVGGVVVPINTRYKAAEAAYVLQKSGAQLLFTVDGFLGSDFVGMLDDAKRPPGLRGIILMRGSRAGATSWSSFIDRGALVTASEVHGRSAAVRPNDVSDIIFTSGTTGLPKGAMLSHGASVWAWRNWNEVVGLFETDRYLIVFPFFHTAGLKGALLGSVIAGCAMLPHPVFDVPSVMRQITDHEVTVLPGPPTVFQSMLDHPEIAQLDVASLRLAVTGGASVPVELIRRMRSELPFQSIVAGYGLTETVGIVSTCRADDPPETLAHTCGRALPGVEIAIAGDKGHRLGPEETGEVLTRGPNLMAGYFENEEETALSLDSDGWLHTGDIGLLDKDGNLRITDRMKDMFIVGGFNAYPAEIENAISGHPAISQVAVVGVPDHRMGEVGVAFVVLRSGAALESEELIAWCREEMANYKVPRHVEVVEALPLNATGKVLKFELRQQARYLSGIGSA